MSSKAAAPLAHLCVVAALALTPAIARADPLVAEDGQRALKEARYEDAWRMLAPMAKAAKATPQVRFWAAEAAIKLQRFQEALGYLTELEAELVAVADEIYARKARCHTALGAFDAAIAAWHEALLHHPSAQIAHEGRYALGPLWLAKGNPVAAVVAFKNALSLGPKDARADEARLRVAGLEQAQGNIKGAQADLTHLVATAQDPVAQEAAAALQNLLRSYPEAVTEPAASERQEDDTNTAPSWQVISSVRDAQRLLAQKRSDEAVASLRRLLKHSKPHERAAISTTLGNMLAQLGRTPEAVQVFDALAQSVRAGSKKQDAQFRAAYLSYDGKNYRDAKTRFNGFLGAYPRHRSADEALWFSAWCNFHLGSLDSSIVDLARLRRQFGKSALLPRAQWWSARLLTLRHRDGEARALLRELMFTPGYYGMLARQKMAAEPNANVGRAAAPTPLHSQLTLWNPTAPRGANGQMLSSQTPDEEALAFLMAQGTQVLDWASPQGVRVSTLISLGLTEEAALWVGAVRGLPGVHAKDQALGRGQILFALGDYTLAMRQVMLVMPPQLVPNPDPWHEMALKLAYPPAFADQVSTAASTYKVSELLLLSLMRQESAFNTRASSQVSAKGLMQIMPFTGRRIAKALGLKTYTDAQLLSPELNIQLAAWYIAALLERFNGNLAVAIGSYNAGPKVTQKWLQEAKDASTDVFVEDIPFRETRDYVKKVLANLEMYSRIYDADVPPWPERVMMPQPQGVDF